MALARRHRDRDPDNKMKLKTKLHVRASRGKGRNQEEPSAKPTGRDMGSNGRRGVVQDYDRLKGVTEYVQVYLYFYFSGKWGDLPLGYKCLIFIVLFPYVAVLVLIVFFCCKNCC